MAYHEVYCHEFIKMYSPHLFCILIKYFQIYLVECMAYKFYYLLELFQF